MLKSKLFSKNQRLNNCAVSDPSHVLEGDKGEHVKLIQEAICAIDGATIDEAELKAGFYGKFTAAAVLAYKRKRNIVNPSYQKTADAIVGKMTIARLDKEVEELEQRVGTGFTIRFTRPIRSRL